MNCVPIHLDIDIEGRRLRDSFLWHYDEYMCTPEIFAERLVKDEKLPWIFTKEIASSIRRQLVVGKKMSSPSKNSKQIIVLDIIIENVRYHDQIEWDCTCPRNDPIIFARATCQDLNLPQAFEAAIAFGIREQICRPLHSKKIRVPRSNNTNPVYILTPSERGHAMQLSKQSMKSQTTSIYSGELEPPKDPMIVKWIDTIEMKLPRQSHAYAEFLRIMRTQLTGEVERGKLSQDVDDYIAKIWNEHTDSRTRNWFVKLAERNNVGKNKEFRRKLRDDGVQLWEGEEANRKSLREGGELGDLLQKRKLSGLRLSRKNLSMGSNLLRESRAEERAINFERIAE